MSADDPSPRGEGQTEDQEYPYQERDTTDEDDYDRVYDDDSLFPYVPLPFGWTPSLPGRGYDENAEEHERVYDEVGSEEGSWWDEGLITLAIVVGLVLFLFPEPATSALGAVLFVAGVMGWLVDLATSGT